MPLYYLAKGVFALRTFDGEEDPQQYPLRGARSFYVTSSIHEKHKGFGMLKVRKTPSLSLLAGND
jgi:hypothetical protein